MRVVERHVKSGNKSKVNAYIMAMYVFQFGFLQPIASLVNSQIPVAVFTLILILVALFHNEFKFKRYVVIVSIFLNTFFLANAIVLSPHARNILAVYVEFLAKGLSAFVIASLPVDDEELYSSFLIIAVVNFFAIGLYPFVSFLSSMNYMRFGYAMLPSVIMFAYALFDSKFRSVFWLAAFLLSSLLMLIYGSRGTIVALLIYTVLIFVSSKTISAKKKLLFLVIVTTLTLTIIEFDLLTKGLDYLYFDMGIKTYSLAKLRMMTASGLAVSSSGRDTLYKALVEIIKKSPAIGHGVGATQRYLGEGYTAHNIFLQILVETGIVGLICWSLMWFFCLIEYFRIGKTRGTGFYRIVTMLGAISFGRLLVSSDMWLRPEYWFFTSMLISSYVGRNRIGSQAPRRRDLSSPHFYP